MMPRPSIAGSAAAENRCRVYARNLRRKHCLTERETRAFMAGCEAAAVGERRCPPQWLTEDEALCWDEGYQCAREAA
jgi:hypothetical protein